MLQNLIPSFPWIAPPGPPPWRNPRKGRDQILPSGNHVTRCKCSYFGPSEAMFADHLRKCEAPIETRTATEIMMRRRPTLDLDQPLDLTRYI